TFGSTRSFSITSRRTGRSTSRHSSRTLIGRLSIGACADAGSNHSQLDQCWFRGGLVSALSICTAETFCDNAAESQLAKEFWRPMRIPKTRLIFLIVCAALMVAACQKNNENANTTATTAATPPGAQELTQVSRPPKIEQMMKE